MPFPPLYEQRQIAAVLEVVGRKIEAEENREAALQALFKTMLHQLMTGELRVGPRSSSVRQNYYAKDQPGSWIGCRANDMSSHSLSHFHL